MVPEREDPAYEIGNPPPASVRRCGVSVFAIIAVALFSLVAAPAEAHAAPATSVLVNGIDIAADPDNTLEFGAGTATYNKVTGVLTLNNVTISDSSENAIIRPQWGQLTLELVGKNTLSGSGRGLYANTGGSLSITGTGSLSINTKGEAVQVDQIDLVCDGCSLNLSSRGWCMSAWGGTVTIQNGANVTATTEGVDSVAVTGEKGISVNSAKLTAETTSNNSGPALYAAASIDIKDAAVISTSAGLHGILARGSVSVSNSTVQATALKESNGYGISANPAIDVSGASELLSRGGLDVTDVVVSPTSGSLLDVKVGGRNAALNDLTHFDGSPVDTETTFGGSSGLGDYGCVRIAEHQHTFDQQVVSDATLALEATCSRPARYYYSCACGQVGPDTGQPASDTFASGDPLGHTWNDWVVTKAPTCTETGAEMRTCARGDAQEARKVDALGHDLKHVDAVAATCTEAGTAEHWVCSRCGALFSDAGATKTVAAEDLAIEPTGHRFENGTCTVCGAKDPDYVTPTQPNKDEEPEIPATGDPASLASALFGAGAALAGAVTVWRRRSSRHAA